MKILQQIYFPRWRNFSRMLLINFSTKNKNTTNKPPRSKSKRKRQKKRKKERKKVAFEIYNFELKLQKVNASIIKITTLVNVKVVIHTYLADSELEWKMQPYICFHVPECYAYLYFAMRYIRMHPGLKLQNGVFY